MIAICLTAKLRKYGVKNTKLTEKSEIKFTRVKNKHRKCEIKITRVQPVNTNLNLQEYKIDREKRNKVYKNTKHVYSK